MIQGASNISINLGSKKKPSFTNTFFAWSITIGRGIIVLTELVALAALSYRFIIDRQIVDLHDQIKSAETLLKIQTKQENDYRDLQSRLNNIKNIDETTNNKVTILAAVLQNLTKNQVTTNKLVLNENSLVLGGNAPSIFSLADLVDNLKSQKNVDLINISRVNSLQQGINFEMSVNIKK